MTSEQRANLAKLSAYLKALPEDYARFEMATFLGVNRRDTSDIFEMPELEQYLRQNGGPPGCGTVACAVGHGPAAHIFMTEKEITGGFAGAPDWDAYVERVFGTEDDTFEWMFGGDWHRCDNTPLGAAKRIDYFLAYGVPEDFDPSCPETYDVEIYQ